MARLTAGLAMGRRAALLMAALALALAAVPGAASAATINVVDTGDAPAGGFDDSGCTLRDAVQAANTNTPVSTCNADNAGADTIVLPGGKTYTISQHAVDDSNAKGDLDITGPVTIRSSGPGLATIDAGNTFSAGGPEAGADRAIDVRSTAGAVTLDGLRITNGFANPAGTTVGGGGILNAAQLTVLNSEIVGNQVQGTGTTLGGGIYTRGSLGTLTMIGSTVANNRGFALGNAGPETVGGGIASYDSSPTMTITNSTISGNTVTGSAGTNGGPGLVGGIFAGDSGNHPTANLTHVTITGNQALNPGGSFTGGLEIAAGTMTGDLVAGNSDPFGTFPDCDQVGTVTSGGGNLIGDPADPAQDCNFTGPGDLVGTHAAPLAANLGTLVDNGGLTRTEVPNAGSPAIDRGGSSCPDTDQRGFVRGPKAPCDAGAVEVGALPPGAAAGTVGSKQTARAEVNGKVKVKDLGNGHFLVITGISAACPDGGGTCTGSAAVNSTGAPKRLASVSKAAKKLGKAKLSVAAGRTQPVTVKLTKKASSALSSSGKLKVKISVNLAAPGGTPATASRRAKLKRPH